MADLQPEVPEKIEQRLDDVVGGPALGALGQEQKVNVGIWRQLTAPVPSDGDKRDPGAAMPLEKNVEKRRKKPVHAE